MKHILQLHANFLKIFIQKIETFKRNAHFNIIMYIFIIKMVFYEDIMLLLVEAKFDSRVESTAASSTIREFCMSLEASSAVENEGIIPTHAPARPQTKSLA